MKGQCSHGHDESREPVVTFELTMTLAESMDLVRRQQGKARKRRLFLICGFEPLHLGTFLKAHFALRFDEEEAEVRTGLYGDIDGSLTTAASSDADAAAVFMEWSDLDSRLGLRSAGGWQLSVQDDILASCRERLARLPEKLERLASRMPVVLVAPTLPIPLLGHSAGWQIGRNELELERQLAVFLADAALLNRVTILNPARLNALSPAATRLNVASELKTGFPYSLEHASVLAGLAVQGLFPAAPMKGLITDLDGTFWSGIVGEVGPGGVSWSQAEHSQIHGLYQQLLRHFSEMGVLLAIASKNESSVVERALGRGDLFVPAASFYPVCADWGAKSRHIETILRAWNVGADSVVFIDDSPMELDEVKTAFPSLTCLPFPVKQPAAAFALLERLRDLFGKPGVQREDAIRQSSLKAFHESAKAGGGGDFVKSLEGRIAFGFTRNTANNRLPELINKTNQFNLNGARVTEAEWLRHLSDPAGFTAGISYEDKFGPLGVIGVVAGRRNGDCLEVTTWVMSCRAFSRRIEFHTLECLFASDGGVRQISLVFRPTERNQPLREFLLALGLDEEGPWILSREKFDAARHELPHKVSVTEEAAASV